MNVADVAREFGTLLHLSGMLPEYDKYIRKYHFLHHSLVHRPGRQYLTGVIYSTYATLHRCFPEHLEQKGLAWAVYV